MYVFYLRLVYGIHPFYVVFNCCLFIEYIYFSSPIKFPLLQIQNRKTNGCQHNSHWLVNRPGEAKAVLQKPSSPIDWLTMVQTVKSPKGLSGIICPWEVARVIRLSRGAQPRGKVWLPEGSPVGKFFRNPWWLFTVCETLGFKYRRRCGPELPHGLVRRNSGFGLAQVWQC